MIAEDKIDFALLIEWTNNVKDIQFVEMRVTYQFAAMKTSRQSHW